MFKIVDTQKFLGLKNVRKTFLRNFKKVRNFWTQKLLGVKNCKHLLISIPKCIELNS